MERRREALPNSSVVAAKKNGISESRDLSPV
jgi:hypothetical protein